MHDNGSLIPLIEAAAKMRGKPPVLRQYIKEALQRIDAGTETVSKYPNTGLPSLKGVYDIAAKLESAAAPKN
jgi:DNA replicative helicase MCM subunit Mcm2 (Cdc46/Mcm family)